MRLGICSDVHGNLLALDAVVADGREQGVEAWWVLGDLVAMGPAPVATLERIANLPGAVATRGNTERYVLAGDRPRPSRAEARADPAQLDLLLAVEASFSWTRGAVTQGGWLGWLAELPLEMRTVLPDGTRLLGVHASPGRDDGDGIAPDVPDDVLAERMAGAAADIVVAGHTHRPTDRVAGGVRAVNDGSVSNPITTDLRAGYVIVHADRHGHRVEHRRVAYDREAVVRQLQEVGHPTEPFLVAHLRGEHGRHPTAL